MCLPVHGAHASDEIRRRDVLQQIRFGASHERALDVIVRVERRENDEHGIGVLASDLLHDLDAVQSRHPEVDERHVRSLPSIQRNRRLAIGRLGDDFDVWLFAQNL